MSEFILGGIAAIIVAMLTCPKLLSLVAGMITESSILVYKYFKGNKDE